MSENGIVPSSCEHSLSSAESWRTRFGRIILSRPVGILAGSITLGIFLGCMSLSIGCRTESDSISCQEGKVSLRCGEELDVYYPVPYASPPNLEISGDPNDYEITEQKADHFRICCKVSHDGGQHWSWKARGPKCASPVAAPTVIVTPPSPPPVPPTTNGPPVPLPPPTPIQAP